MPHRDLPAPGPGCRCRYRGGCRAAGRNCGRHGPNCLQLDHPPAARPLGDAIFAGLRSSEPALPQAGGRRHARAGRLRATWHVEASRLPLDHATRRLQRPGRRGECTTGPTAPPDGPPPKTYCSRAAAAAVALSRACGSGPSRRVGRVVASSSSHRRRSRGASPARPSCSISRTGHASQLPARAQARLELRLTGAHCGYLSAHWPGGSSNLSPSHRATLRTEPDRAPVRPRALG